MTARFADYNTACSFSASGCPSALVRPILDAAIILVVSVCAVIVRIIGLTA